MNENRNVLWIALAGVLIVLAVAYLLARPPMDAAAPSAGAPAATAPAGTPAAEGPLAPAVPVLPPEPTPTPTPAPATVPEAPASGAPAPPAESPR
jgi:hypothetical protein